MNIGVSSLPNCVYLEARHGLGECCSMLLMVCPKVVFSVHTNLGILGMHSIEREASCLACIDIHVKYTIKFGRGSRFQPHGVCMWAGGGCGGSSDTSLFIHDHVVGEEARLASLRSGAPVGGAGSWLMYSR